VNLIGEHTDYNGLPVMPMAISRDMLIAAGRSGDRAVHVTNTERSFENCVFSIERNIPPYTGGNWGNYVKSATQGLIDFWGTDEGLAGLNITVDGNVPLASGLSSSAAFTIACAEAILAVNNREIPPLELAEIMANSDHYVGMASGGMDQATSILGKAGMCLKIDFFPIRTQPVRLPPDSTVVVCHSRVTAAKAGNAKDEYNRRTVECRLAVAVLHARGSAADKPEPDLLSQWLAEETEGYADALDKIERLLKPGGYTAEMLAEILDKTEQEVIDTYFVTKAGQNYPAPPEGFLLKKRARHVIAETERVEASLALLKEMPHDAAERFGALMNASHESCRDDYGISCPELDALVAAGRRAGAFGARLTGAGFGGCTVNLIPAGTAREFMQEIDRHYYEPRGLTNYTDNQFEFKPASGAGIVFG
jgi:N-acetylgalactosamine kinase